MLQANVVQKVEELFQIGSHLGHKKNRVHPKARKFIYRMVNGTSVIDLTQTVSQLDKAKAFLTQVASEEKTVLLVATKKVASAYLKEYCQTHHIPHITSKWLPGLLTNFQTLMKNVKKLTELKEKETTGNWENLVKHERIKLTKEKTRLEKLYGGLESLKAMPQILIIVDARKEKNAVKEAQEFNIPIVSLMDTNSNPELIDYVIMANDDASVVIERIMKELLDAYTTARDKVPTKVTTSV